MPTKTQLPESVLTKKQSKQIKIFKKDITPSQLQQLDEGDRGWVQNWKLKKPIIVFTLRYDDEDGDGHNSFAITGDGFQSSGCLHEYFKIFCPDLAHLIKWVVCSSESPMHYVANTLYHASDKDCWGKRKGEPTHFKTKVRVEGFPDMEFSKDFREVLASCDDFSSVTVAEVPYGKDSSIYSPKYTFSNHDAKWHQCPFDTELEAQQYLDLFRRQPFQFVEIPTQWSKGKEPDLEAARNTAIAPNATLEQLRDKDWLESRLPELVNQFKTDMESLGFTY